jgi:hypothetical protein
MSDATLTKRARVSDGQGGYTQGAATSHACLAIISDYSDAIRAMSGAQGAGGGIGSRDRKGLIIAQSLPAGVTPQVDDEFTLSGSWRILAVKADPAKATYEIQLRPV